VLGPDGTVYFGIATTKQLTGGLYAFTPDGAFKWRSNVTESSCDPAVASDGTIYIGSSEGYLYAVNPDGSLKWKFYTGDNTNAWYGSKALIAADGTIYIAAFPPGSGAPALFAVNPDGSLKWQAAGVADPESATAIGPDGTVYCGDTGTVRAINLDGSVKWEESNIGGGDLHLALGPDGTIYAGSQWHLFALNQDGSMKWDYSGSLFYSAPSIGADGTIYAACSSPDRLLALNPDGSMKWQTPHSSIYSSWSPAVGADGSIYVGGWCDDPNNPNQSCFFSFSPGGTMNGAIEVGKNIWDAFIGNSQGHGASIGPDGTVYATAGNLIYAFNTSSTGPAKSSWPMYGHDSARTGQLVLPSTFSISGRITSHGSGLAGVSIDLEGKQGPGPSVGLSSGLLNRTTTDSKGNYSFPGLHNGSYTVTPTLTGYTFSPVSSKVEVNGGHATVNEIAATLDTVDGTVKWNSFNFQSTSEPALALDGTIYVGANTEVNAFNPDGSVKWSHQTACTIGAVSVGSDGTVYLADDCGGGLGSGLYALKPNGAPRWSHPTQIITLNPAIASDGTIYVVKNTDPSNVYTEMSMVALNPNGSQKWSSAVIKGHPISDPAIGPDGAIYFSADNSPSQQGNNRYGLYAVDPLKGGIKWRFASGDNLMEPTFGSDGTIYLGSGGHNFYAINPDGNLKWEISSSNEPNFSNFQTLSPVIGADGAIYFATFDGRLLALNPDGSVKWWIPPRSSLEFAQGAVPALGLDGTIYATGASSLAAVDPVDGTIRWNLKFASENSGIFISPDGVLYLNSQGLLAVNSGSMGLAKAPWPTLWHDNQHTSNYSYAAPKKLTITAKDQSVVYGGSLPPLTYTVSPDVRLKTTPTCVSSVNERSNAGEYPDAITCSGASAEGYWISYVSGDMKVYQATLRVAADNKSMKQGGPLPKLTAGYSGFVNGDSPAVLSGAPSLSTKATAASKPGRYTITVGQGTLKARNYIFRFVDGILTIQ
jgi:outer membrane protein assembly factor BamB